MSILAEPSTILSKTQELCQTISEAPEFNALQGQISLFLEDEIAKQLYRGVQLKGEELQNKQMAGVQLSDVEISEFETMRSQLFQNEITKGFIDAQQALNALQQEIGRYVGMTIELGRVPSSEEIAEASQNSGCCGGGSGGSCGC